MRTRHKTATAGQVPDSARLSLRNCGLNPVKERCLPLRIHKVGRARATEGCGLSRVFHPMRPPTQGLPVRLNCVR
jgi:hypothetical protein